MDKLLQHHVLPLTPSQDPLEPVAKPNIGNGTGITPAIQFSQEEQSYHKHLTLGIEEKLRNTKSVLCFH